LRIENYLPGNGINPQGYSAALLHYGLITAKSGRLSPNDKLSLPTAATTTEAATFLLRCQTTQYRLKLAYQNKKSSASAEQNFQLNRRCQMIVSIDSTLGVILDDPQARAVLDQYIPGASTNPMIGMARGMTLRMLLTLPQAAQFGVTEEKINVILAEINKLG
jgi:hypothetical protein